MLLDKKIRFDTTTVASNVSRRKLNFDNLCLLGEIPWSKMETSSTGYDENRFTSSVDVDLHCAICLNVLNEPLQCRSNEHHFCSSCIKRHLKNFRKCPSCMEELTLETLKKPSRFLTKSLSDLSIHCDHEGRGCPEVVLLPDLKAHLLTCEFSPVKCSNEGCSEVVSKRERVYHEIQTCKFRKLKCNDCRETKKNIDEMKSRLEELSHAMSQVLLGMNLVSQTNTSLGCLSGSKAREDIVVAGGRSQSSRFNSVEMFSWSTKAWVEIQPMRLHRSGASSVVYENKIIVTGGRCGELENSASMEALEFDKKTAKWSNFPAKLPDRITTHTSLVYKDRLIVIGGCDSDGNVLNSIHEVLLVPPYSSKLVCRMPQPVCFNGTELFGNEIFIVGGCTAPGYSKVTDNVLKYKIGTDSCSTVYRLPFPVGGAATVRWQRKIIVIGGVDGKASDEVIMFDMDSGDCDILPKMMYKRRGCVAVLARNKIVVMGGTNEDSTYLDTVECFSFDRNCWELLLPMIRPRSYATAVVTCCNFD